MAKTAQKKTTKAAEPVKPAAPAVTPDAEKEAKEFAELIAKVRAAQKKFSTYTQEQVDKIFRAAALAANNMRIPLAKDAVAETGMGIVEDKVIKNHYAAEYIYNTYKNTKTCGVIEKDEAMGIEKLAEPIGVIGAVIPTTNPTSTAIFKTLLALKTRNGIIISPHPRAKKCTYDAAMVVYEAAVKAGAPEDIIACIKEPSIASTQMLMKEADCILATGGPAMVKAAYSSGKPALGVGPGNTPVIMDASCDVKLAVSSVIHSKTFDNGMICASEQSVIVDDKIYDQVKKEFAYRGCYLLKPAELDAVRKIILTEAGTVNPKIVGQKAATIAKLAGLTVPEDAKILIGEVKSVEVSEPFAHEKLSPVLAMYRSKDFADAVNKAEKLVAGDEKLLRHVRWERVPLDRAMFDRIGELTKQGYRIDAKKSAARYAAIRKDGRNFLTAAGVALFGAVGSDDSFLFDTVLKDIAAFPARYGSPEAKVAVEIVMVWVRNFLRAPLACPDWLERLDLSRLPAEWRRQAAYLAVGCLDRKGEYKAAAVLADALLNLEVEKAVRASAADIYLKVAKAAVCRDEGRLEEAGRWCRAVVESARPRGIVLPFLGLMLGPKSEMERALASGAPKLLAKIKRKTNGYFRNLVRYHNRYTGDRISDELTPREFYLAQSLKRGLSYKEVAVRLGVSVANVHNLIVTVYGKLHIRSNRELKDKVW